MGLYFLIFERRPDFQKLSFEIAGEKYDFPDNLFARICFVNGFGLPGQTSLDFVSKQLIYLARIGFTL